MNARHDVEQVTDLIVISPKGRSRLTGPPDLSDWTDRECRALAGHLVDRPIQIRNHPDDPIEYFETVHLGIPVPEPTWAGVHEAVA